MSESELGAWAEEKKRAFESYEEGRNLTKNLEGVLKEYSCLEDHFSCKLEKQLHRLSSDREGKKWGNEISTLNNWYTSLCQVHAQLASDIHSDVYVRLSELKREQDIQKENLVREISVLDCALFKETSVFNRARNKYMKACMEYERSFIEVQILCNMSKSKDLEKARAKMCEDRHVAKELHSVYCTRLLALRWIQNQHAASMSDILDQFRQLEYARYSQLLDSFRNLAKANDLAIELLSKGNDMYRSSVEKFDLEKEMQSYDQAIRYPSPDEFLTPYKPYESKLGVEMPFDPSETLKDLDDRELTTPTSSNTKPCPSAKSKKKEYRLSGLFGFNSSSSRKHSVSSGFQKSIAPVSKSVKQNPTERRKSNESLPNSSKVDPSERKSSEGSSNSSKTDTSENSDNVFYTVGQKDELSTTGRSNEGITSPSLNTYPPSSKSTQIACDSSKSTSREQDVNLELKLKTISECCRIAKTIHDYAATHPSELSFKEGEIALIYAVNGAIEMRPGWTKGQIHGKEGLIPSEYLEIQEKAKLCVTLYDFEAVEEEELDIKEGDILIVESVHDGWHYGRNLQGKGGLFPSSYVKIF